jgi:hypothetical protein
VKSPLLTRRRNSENHLLLEREANFVTFPESPIRVRCQHRYHGGGPHPGHSAGRGSPQLQLVLESNDLTLIVCIGPQRYWAEKGIPFNIGDRISVRGSKAQGDDGTIYILAQKADSDRRGSHKGAPLIRGSGHPPGAGFPGSAPEFRKTPSAPGSGSATLPVWAGPRPSRPGSSYSCSCVREQ